MGTELLERTPFSAGDESLPPVNNALGREALAYRVRTHASFKRAMVDALAHSPELRSLAHGDPTDPALALVDAWATTLDVLTFYQERIANENYLRTATERRSLQALSRAVGYELNPGVAATTYLAFTLEEGDGAAEKVTIDAGTKVQSVPGPGEQAQVFETVEPIEARPEWNVLKPKVDELRNPQQGDKAIYLQGVNLGLKPGDGLLIVGKERAGEPDKDPPIASDPISERWDFRRIQTVEVDNDNSCTWVTWNEALGCDRHNPPTLPTTDNPTVYTFRLRVGLFGHNAPDWNVMGQNFKTGYLQTGETDDRKWPHFTLAEICTQPTEKNLYMAHLDAAYPQIRPCSWLVLARPNYTELYEVIDTVESAQAKFALSSKTTLVTLKGENFNYFNDLMRETVVFAQSEELKMAKAPLFPPKKILDGKPEILPVTGNQITLESPIPLLSGGRTLCIIGMDEIKKEVVSQTATLDHMSQDGLTLFLTDSLRSVYQRDSVSIYANVARATHGETREEVLGSGDAAQSFQQFALREAPLTYQPAATASGGCSTLDVRVNDIRWAETSTLYAQEARARLFTTAEGPDGQVVIEFGDGVTGARLPSGAENVSATYRVGLGAVGNLKADQVRILLSSPLGVRSVRNPQPATGGADPEDVTDARRNAAYTALTLDRIVSLRDYEDFARAFGGVGKASADRLWNGTRDVVFITVIDPDGKALSDESLKRLRQAINGACDPAQQVEVATKAAQTFTLAARLIIQPRYQEALVLAAARAALRSAFSFKQRDFGQDVAESDILGLLQTVEGVEAADLTPSTATVTDWDLSDERKRLEAKLAYLKTDKPPTIEPATLLMLDEAPEAISLHVVSDLSVAESKGEK